MQPSERTEQINAIAAFPCKRHSSKAGDRCNVRVACCSYRKAIAKPCLKCGASIGQPCVNLSNRRHLGQGWEPEPHKERKAL